MSPKQSATIERDCVHFCKSKVHGDLLSAVLTKRALNTTEICSYLNWVCGNCAFVLDSVYRTLLHVAASVGKKDVVEWLIQKTHAPVDAKDRESGYTALHRSVFYGQINVTVSLMKLGVNLNILDNDGLTAIDHAMKDRLSGICYSIHNDCEVYMWGTNSNYTLGLQQTRPYPELLSKQNIDVPIKQVCLRKFHCVMVSKSGRVYSCGHGQGGRLGLGQNNTAMRPTLITFNTRTSQSAVCRQAAIGRDHSMFLMDSSILWTCGLNTHHVLGLSPPPEMLLNPKPLPEFKTQIHGICAGRFHSVAWGTSTVYTWGLNAGQLGHDATPRTIITPKKVTNFRGSEVSIVDVAASDGATVVHIQRGDIYVLHEYQCRKIASRQLNVAKVAVIGGHLNSKLDKSLLMEREPLKVLVLTKSGNVLLWQESTLQLTRCIFSLNRSLIISDAVLNKSNILLVTTDGEAFQGQVRAKKKPQTDLQIQKQINTKKSPFHEFLDKHECEIITVSRLCNVHRAVSIHSDSKGRNFAVLQNEARVHMSKIPEISRSNIKAHMFSLLENSDEMDTVHDVIFKVGTNMYPAHRFVIANASGLLEEKIKSSPTKYVEITNIHPNIFYQLLEFVYTKNCSLLDGQDIEKSTDCFEMLKKSDQYTINDKNKSNVDLQCCNKKKNVSIDEGKTIDIRNPVRMLQSAAKHLGVIELYNLLDSVTYANGKVHFKKDFHPKEIKFERQSFAHLFDVQIKCNNNMNLHAHKCILAGRLDYFNNLFAMRWNEQSTRTVVTLPFPHKIIENVIDFLYTDFAHNLEADRDIDRLCNVLTVADQLFITRLKEICETRLVSELSLRNVTQLLQFADVYNADILKQCSLNFICINLPSLLESRSLESLNDSQLDELSRFYWDGNDKLQSRMITPYSIAPADEIVKSIYNAYPINLEENYEIDKKQVKPSIKKKTRVRKSSTSENCKTDMNTDSDMCLRKSIPDELYEKPFDIINGTNRRDANTENSEWTVKLNSQQKSVQARLRAIAITGSESFSNYPTNFTKLNNLQRSPVSSSPPNNFECNSLVGSPEYNHFPELSFSPKSADSVFDYVKSPPKYGYQKIQKISQKQRKKMEAENSMNGMINQFDNFNKKISPCKSIPETVSNDLTLGNVMKVDVRYGRLSGSSANTSQSNISPKNPWRIINVPDLQNEDNLQFPDIIANEQKKKENFTKMLAKPLFLTQIEDRAIEELRRFYNVENNFDEYLTVQRVTEKEIAAPVWVNTK